MTLSYVYEILCPTAILTITNYHESPKDFVFVRTVFIRSIPQGRRGLYLVQGLGRKAK